MNGLKHVDVLVQRGNTTKIPVTVPYYEIPVLEAIHNQEGEAGDVVLMVTEVPGTERLVPTDITADEAYDNLRRKYQANGSVEALAYVYRNKQEFARAFHVEPMDEPAKRGRPRNDASVAA